MFTSTDLKATITLVRPIIERQLDDATEIAGHREKVTAQGGDWSQLKALVKAMIQDERDEAGGHKRVMAILHKADNALGYADMLGLGNLNEKNSFADRAEQFAADVLEENPPNDPVTGEIIEPDTSLHNPQGSQEPSNMQNLHIASEPASAADPATVAETAMVAASAGEGGEDAPALPADTQSRLADHEPTTSLAGVEGDEDRQPNSETTNGGSDENARPDAEAVNPGRRQLLDEEPYTREDTHHDLGAVARPANASEGPGRSLASDANTHTSNSEPVGLRICPRRDAICPHGMSCAYWKVDMDCSTEPRPSNALSVTAGGVQIPHHGVVRA